MSKLVIKVSDMKRINTTQIKIEKTLSKYNLAKIDKVIFYIQDMFYPPIDKNKWRKILIKLQEIVFNKTYYKEMIFNDECVFINIPEVEIKFGKQLKKLYSEW